MNLETDATGQKSWQFRPAASPSTSDPAGTAAAAIGIGDIEVANGTVTYRDGATGAVEIPHAAAFDVPRRTWEAGINVPSPSSQARRILGKGGVDNAFALWIQPGSARPTVTWTVAGLGHQEALLNAQVVGVGWVHVAFTYDGDTWRTYVNGVEDQSGVLDDALITNASPLVLGRDEAAGAGIMGFRVSVPLPLIDRSQGKAREARAEAAEAVVLGRE